MLLHNVIRAELDKQRGPQPNHKRIINGVKREQVGEDNVQQRADRQNFNQWAYPWIHHQATD
jgi:hypothetical protein